MAPPSAEPGQMAGRQAEQGRNGTTFDASPLTVTRACSAPTFVLTWASSRTPLPIWVMIRSSPRAENSAKNGALAVVLPHGRVATIRQMIHETPGMELRIDLFTQTVALPDGSADPFEVDPFRKECLLAGLDEIGLTLRYEEAIRAYEQRQAAESPWLARP